jgi:hypothetical protein
MPTNRGVVIIDPGQLEWQDGAALLTLPLHLLPKAGS